MEAGVLSLTHLFDMTSLINQANLGLSATDKSVINFEFQTSNKLVKISITTLLADFVVDFMKHTVAGLECKFIVQQLWFAQ